MKSLLALSQADKMFFRCGDWPKNKLVSASENNRNRPRILRLLEQAKSEGLVAAKLLDIGPGAVVAKLAHLLSRPNHSQLHPKKIMFNCARILECLIRQNFTAVKLTSLEPIELVQLLKAERYANIIDKILVLDRDIRVVRAAQSAVTDVLTPAFEFHQFNLNEAKMWQAERCDLVCAYKCLHLCHSADFALKQIASMIKVNGLLSTSYQIDAVNFEPLDRQLGLYRFRG